jgi:peptide chain release factor 2
MKWGIVFDLAGKRRELTTLQEATQEQAFWDDPDTARSHMQKVSQLESFLEPWEGLRREIGDLQDLLELAEDDAGMEEEIVAELEGAEQRLADLEFQTVLGGKFDRSSAILSVNAGAGGTEACDWAEMILRMYDMWAQHHKLDFQVVSYVAGEQAGISSATARVVGPLAYGYLKAENGVHRLVRLSPFDASKRRHTSFASVDVIPEIGEDIEVNIPAEELRVDTYRSSGAGGQHVNKTDSAVRITHLPTGIVVSCQNERSQQANRKTALAVLRAKLHEIERRKRREQIAALRGEKTRIDFGSQIRSYVMQPYTMVKDHRTNAETANVAGVLNGDLDLFIRAWLQSAVGENEDLEDET